MKPKTIYIITAALAAVVFSLTMSISFKDDNKQPTLMKRQARVHRTEFPGPSFTSQQSYSGFTSVPGITVVKPPKKKEPVESVINNEPLSDKQDIIDKQSVDVSQKEPSGSPDENNEEDNSTSGITELNKRPPEKEAREMNQHGIMMW
ncbi:MAG: hypothetical protein C4533_00605 [Candidatus Omnitrophota bacterium]|jgi:hypothetical protein|nr:MAG: hypothetical protein C4533_00605 [Candidatus Omnitrophota bacterium]